MLYTPLADVILLHDHPRRSSSDGISAIGFVEVTAIRRTAQVSEFRSLEVMATKSCAFLGRVWLTRAAFGNGLRGGRVLALRRMIKQRFLGTCLSHRLTGVEIRPKPVGRNRKPQGPLHSSYTKAQHQSNHRQA